MQTLRLLGGALALAAPALAAPPQGPTFDTPGTPGRMGQTTRFSTEFNPALGFVVDALGGYTDTDGPEDGFELDLRRLEVNAAAWIDPTAWAYAVVVAEGGEEVEVDEAAVHYLGLGGNSSLRAGKFFVDFGKQMQAHVDELRTVDRPAVLREYLGEELPGVGLQYGSWFPAGDASAVRFSLGVFSSLLPEEHGEEEAGEGPEAVDDGGLQDLDELAFTARVTGFRDVGETGVLQAGLSARLLPSFRFEAEGAGLDPLADRSNAVYGLDLTYGWTDDTATRSWTLGGEYLVQDGDLFAELDDPLAPSALLATDDTVDGFYLFADHAWSRRSSAGLQWSRAERALPGTPTLDEYEVYYTRELTEFQRLRLAVTLADLEDADDELRVALQYTAYVGNHAHGIDW